MKTFNELQIAVAQEISKKLHMFKHDEAEVLIEHILQAKNVVVVGSKGRMKNIASAINSSLVQVGIKSSPITKLTKDSLLIVLSATGEEEDMIALTQKSLSSGCTVLTLSPNESSSVSELGHTQVNIPTFLVASGTDESIQPGTTLTEQSLLVYFDIICIQISQALGNT